MDGKQWAMFLHLSQLAGLIVPGLGLVAPFVIWQIKKEQFPELEPHGKMVTNWIISELIYSLAIGVLAIITCGIGALLIIPIAVIAIVFPILGASRRAMACCGNIRSRSNSSSEAAGGAIASS